MKTTVISLILLLYQPSNNFTLSIYDVAPDSYDIRPTKGPNTIHLTEMLDEEVQICVQLTVEENESEAYPEVCWPLEYWRDIVANATNIKRIKQ